jgi:hypothetical protein
MTNHNIHVFIGFDDQQPEAYDVCAWSIKKHSGPNVFVHPLKHRVLREIGLFNRPWMIEENGNWKDLQDGRPFSTTFSFTRFLVPQYYEYLGLWHDDRNRWAIFVDSDFIFTQPVELLVMDAENTGKTLSVVKHNYEGKGKPKMDGRDQATYNCKLWSSLMVYDMFKYDVSDEDLDVNKDDGRSLQTFDWYKPGLDNIGSLPEDWNFIPGHSERKTLSASAIHYTEGTPLHPGYEHTKYSGLFNQYLSEVRYEKAKRRGDGL